jgi:hypothetical protein
MGAKETNMNFYACRDAVAAYAATPVAPALGEWSARILKAVENDPQGRELPVDKPGQIIWKLRTERRHPKLGEVVKEIRRRSGLSIHDLNKIMGWKAWECEPHPRYNRKDYSPSGWQQYEGNCYALSKAVVAEMAGKVLGGEWSYDRPLGSTCWRFYRVR